MIPRRLGRDRRGMTPAVSHVLIVAITSILVMGILVAAGGYLDTEQRESARQELDAIGNRLAEEIDRVDNLAVDGSRVAITTRHPDEVTGGSYDVSQRPATACDGVGDACLVLESDALDVTVRVPVVNETRITVRETSEGQFNITGVDAASAATVGDTTEPGSLSLRVGVGSDIREDPLGSRLTARNLAPIPAFSVEPPPVTSDATHFLNGSASLDPDGNVTEHKWDVGDDGLFTRVGEVAPYWFDGPGRHEVTLRAADDARDTASSSVTRTVSVSGLEYNDDLDQPSGDYIEFSLHNNWSQEIRLDSLFVDDLTDGVTEIDAGSDDEIIVEPGSNPDTSIDYDHGTDLHVPGTTIDLDQVLPDADTSAPWEVPRVPPNQDVTIRISGLDSGLRGNNWRLGVAYLRGGEGYETVFADKVGGANVKDLSVESDGDRLTFNVSAGEELRNLRIDYTGPGGTTTVNTGDFDPPTVNGGTHYYEYETGALPSGTYEAELYGVVADDSGQAPYEYPPNVTAVAVDEGIDAAWHTASDWDDNDSERGVVHETFGDRSADSVTLGNPSRDVNGANLTAYWPMDGNQGNSMEDVESGYDGTTHDIFDGTVGLFGTTSYAFTSGSSHVDGIGSSPELSGGDNQTVTVSTWIHPRRAISNSDGSAVIGKLNDTTGGDWSIVLDSTCPSYANGGCDGTPTIGYYGGNDTEEYALLHGPITQADAWHHVAFVLNGENDRLDLFYDGRLVESDGSLPEYASANTSEPVVIGEHPATGANFDGYVDETRIYDRALTGTQVRALSDASTTGSFVTAWRNTSSSVNDVDLSAAVDRNGANVTVRVANGEGELSQPIALDDDRGTYDVSGLSASSDAYRLEVRIESLSKNRSPIIESLVVHG